MIIAITGTIGSGKSTVSKHFKDQGYDVYDADKMVHAYYEKDEPVYNYLVDAYGEKILQDDLSLNRQALAKIVFTNYEELDKLENVVYPIVREEILKIKEKTHNKYVFIEVPLLFEAKMEDIFDKIMMVDASQKTRHQRLLNKGYSLQDILNREKRQYSDEFKKANSDIIINNDGDLKDLYTQLRNVERGEFHA